MEAATIVVGAFTLAGALLGALFQYLATKNEAKRTHDRKLERTLRLERREVYLRYLGVIRGLEQILANAATMPPDQFVKFIGERMERLQEGVDEVAVMGTAPVIHAASTINDVIETRLGEAVEQRLGYDDAALEAALEPLRRSVLEAKGKLVMAMREDLGTGPWPFD